MRVILTTSMTAHFVYVVLGELDQLLSNHIEGNNGVPLNMLLYLQNNSLMEQNQAEEIMEYALQGVGETPIVHLDKSASTLVPLVEQEKKRYLI